MVFVVRVVRVVRVLWTIYIEYRNSFLNSVQVRLIRVRSALGKML